MQVQKFSTLPYTRPDYAAAQQKLRELTEQAEHAADYAALKAIVKERNALTASVSLPSELAFIRCYLDSSNAFYAQEMQYNAQQAAGIDDSAFSAALLNSPFVADFDAEFGPELLQNQRDNLRLNTAAHDLMAKEQQLMAQYQQKKATMRISFRGEELSEGQLDSYMNGPDRAARREALAACNAAYSKDRTDFAQLLDKLVHLRDDIAKANGFADYLAYANLQKGRRSYGTEEILAFCEEVRREIVPLYAETCLAQAERLGLEKLANYDTACTWPDGGAKPIGDGPALLEAARPMYKKLSADISELFETMADNEYIDVTSSPNKISNMGFCTGLPVIDFPYIFGNCTGSMHDTTVLTHEMGHAYQVWLCMHGQPLPEYVNMPNDAVEIPSKAMEQFTLPFAELFFGKDAEKFRADHMQYVLRETCAFCVTYEYEAWLYTHVDASTEERIQRYNEISVVYQPAIDTSESSEALAQGAKLWQDMGLFMFPAYLVSYALSDICALELCRRSEEDFDAAWADYRTLCAAGGSLDYPGLMQLAHLPIAYAPGSAKAAAEFVRTKLNLSKK